TPSAHAGAASPAAPTAGWASDGRFSSETPTLEARRRLVRATGALGDTPHQEDVRRVLGGLAGRLGPARCGSRARPGTQPGENPRICLCQTEPSRDSPARRVRRRAILYVHTCGPANVLATARAPRAPRAASGRSRTQLAARNRARPPCHRRVFASY